MCVYIHTHTRTHIHTYIHTYIHITVPRAGIFNPKMPSSWGTGAGTGTGAGGGGGAAERAGSSFFGVPNQLDFAGAGAGAGAGAAAGGGALRCTLGAALTQILKSQCPSICTMQNSLYKGLLRIEAFL
jgi:hypothetical protein